MERPCTTNEKYFILRSMIKERHFSLEGLLVLFSKFSNESLSLYIESLTEIMSLCSLFYINI